MYDKSWEYREHGKLARSKAASMCYPQSLLEVRTGRIQVLRPYLP